MRYAWVLLVLILTGCMVQPQTTDLNIQQGVIDGARKSTQEAEDKSYQATLAAWQQEQRYFDSTQTAIVGQAMLQTQQANAGTATAWVSGQATLANQTAVAAVFAGADFSATETQRPLDRHATEEARVVALQATATQAAVDAENDKRMGSALRWAVGFAISAIAVVVCLLLWKLGGLVQRKVKAEAEIAEIKALNAGTQVIPQIGIVIFYKPGMDKPEMMPINAQQIPANVPTAPATFQDVIESRKLSSVVEFLELVQRVTNNLASTYIPRFSRMGLSPAEWMEWTDWLEGEGYIEKEEGKKTFCADGWDVFSIMNKIKQEATEASPSMMVGPMTGD
jgi:hypothetical protein